MKFFTVMFAFIFFAAIFSGIALAQATSLPAPDKGITDYSKIDQTNLISLQKFFSGQKVEMFIGGTEYMRGIDTLGKAFASIIVGNVSLDNANCILNIYLPDNSGKFLSDAYMIFLEKGVYYRDFPIAPDMMLGVYPLIVECYFPINHTFSNATSYYVYNGTYTSGSVANTTVYDGISLRFTEALYAAGVRTVNASLNMSVNVTNLTENVNIEFGGEWNGGAGAAGEDVKISIFNFTGNSWVDLPNHIIDASPQSPVNVTNSLPKPFSNFLNGSIAMVKFEDIPAGADGANSNLDIDRLQADVLNNATLQPCTVTGTAELHVTKNIILEMMKSEVEETVLSNHNICTDNMTLVHVLSKVRCTNSECINITQNVTEPCQYGCNSEEVPNSCNLSPTQASWIFFAIIGIIVAIAIVAAAKMR